MFRNYSKILLGYLMGLFLLSTLSLAQFTSSVQGTVTDPQGRSVPAADVKLLNTSTGVEIQAKSDSSGLYRFTGVVPGPYQVRATVPGFATAQVNVTVTADQLASADLALQLATTKNQVL